MDTFPIFPIICLALTFLLSFLLCYWWIKRARKAGLVGKDMHKPGERMVAEIGGLPVITAFLFGILLYVGYRTFARATNEFNLEILAVSSTILIIALIGIVDDILGWKIGLRQYQKPILCLFAALPIMMINIGNTTMNLPFIGPINLGMLYPLIIIPLGIAGAANAFNMLAGYNGLEAGMGIIMLTALGIVAWFFQGLPRVAMIAFVMVASLAAFLLYNKYPAKLFPGNALTYSIGALITVMAILGDMEKFALLIFIPYFVEFVLLLRSRNFKIEAFAKVNEDRSLELPYTKVYDTTHLAIFILKKIKKKVYESDVVYFIWVLEILLIAIIASSLLI